MLVLGRHMRYRLLTIVSITLLSFLAGCDRSGKPIVIVLPDGFTGEFQIVKDSRTGSEPLEKNGSWVFEIPADGTLRVKGDRPFYLWHNEVIRYKNGKSVNCEHLGTTAGRRSTGPNRFEGSTEFDGTTHQWRVVGN
jgi:hypothetical protein